MLTRDDGLQGSRPMAGLYGVVVGATMLVLTTALPEPIGWTVWWSIVAAQLALDAIVVWRRTRLQGMTCSLLWASGIAVVFAVACARGLTLQDLVRHDPVVVVASIFVAAALMVSERWWHPAAWAQFRRKADASSVMDILTCRHIPDLRTPQRN